MSYISGIVAAIVSPLVTTIGFLLWEYFCFNSQNRAVHHWSSFALNLYKCCLATILFIVTIFIISIINFKGDDETVASNYHFFSSFQANNNEATTTATVHGKQQIIGYLILSSVIGIIIGDILWLQALSRLGSVRVIFIDALKPFCATMFGILLLQEPFHYTILIGIILTVSGILCMSLFTGGESQSPDPQPQSDDMVNHVTLDIETNETNVTETTKTGSPTTGRYRYATGYCMSLINVILDTYGSVLTKQYGITISVWEINCIRFGFAGGALVSISIGMILYNQYWYSTVDRTNSIHQGHNSVNAQRQTLPFEPDSSIPVVPVDATTTTPTVSTTAKDRLSLSPTVQHDFNDRVVPAQAVPWYMIPIGPTMNGTGDDRTHSITIWMYISLGVVFVTFIAPTLYNYALLEISLALTLTLTSIGPLYAIPLSYAVQHYVHHHVRVTKTPSKQETDATLGDDLHPTTRSPPRHEPNVVDTKSTTPAPQPRTTPHLSSRWVVVWVGVILTMAGIVVLAYSGHPPPMNQT